MVASATCVLPSSRQHSVWVAGDVHGTHEVDSSVNLKGGLNRVQRLKLLQQQQQEKEKVKEKEKEPKERFEF